MPEAANHLAARLLDAVQAERHAAVQTLLAAHPTLVRDHLHVAAAVGAVDAVADLLARGADPNAVIPVEPEGHLAVPVLYVACLANQPAVVRRLLEAGANPNDGESVYHAAERDHRECLALLLAHGAALSDRHPHWDNTPLYFLAGFPATHPRAETVARGIAWLLEHGADPTIPSGVATTADRTPGVGELPLHRVASLGDNPRVATLLLASGTPVDAPRADGRTALALAVRGGHIAMAALLQAHGADPAAVTPLDQLAGACFRNDAAALAALTAAHPDLQTLADRPMTADLHGLVLQACATGQVAAVKQLLRHGWSLAQQGPWGGTALHWGAWHGRPAVVAALLAHPGIAPLVNCRDRQYGSSPIAWGAHGSTQGRTGAEADYLAVTEALIAAGATRAESINRWGESPESMASPAVADRLRRWATAAEPA